MLNNGIRQHYDKDEVKQHVNIERYYRAEFGDFKVDSKGNAKVLCCFHQEKTPSLSLNRDTGAYHCFGCGAKGGDVFAFYQQKHNLTEKDFPQILKYFANRAGILPKNNGTAKKDTTLSKDETLYTPEQIKAYRPGGRVFDRYHFYIAGDTQYIKVIYKKQNEPGDKTAMFYTLVDREKKLYKSGRMSKPVLFNQELLKQKLDELVIWTEGEKDAENVTALGLLAVTAGGTNSFMPEMAQQLRGRDVCLLHDYDEPGEKDAQKVARGLHGIAKVIKIVELPGLPENGKDVSDWIDNGGTKEQLLKLIEEAPEWTAPAEIPEAEALSIMVVSIAEFLSMDFPPRENLLSPILPSQGLMLVHAYRGVGKTHVSLGMAVAVASGGKFLRWQADNPRGVLFLDGEMPAIAIKERLSHAIINAEKEIKAPLYIVTNDLQKRGMPDLATVEGQLGLEPYLEDVDLVIVDNISTLCREGRENEAESWLPVQGWALQLRARGKSVVFVHHEGKSGNQRGTTKREDVLDTVIRLKRPGDYREEEGARFEVHYEKHRGFYGNEAKPFEAQLINGEDGTRTWTDKDLEDSLTERVADLLNEGIPQQEIHEMLGVAKGTVSKHKKKAQEQGLLKGTSS